MRQIAARLLLSFAAYLAATRCLWADILTAQYDSFRTSWNASEIYLNVGNVNQARFGKLFSRQLDGWVYAQPLYMRSLTLPGHGAVNVVFVCTANNTVYAFDADSASVSAPYWSTNLGPADNTPNGPGSPNSEPLLGIISTPVIVPAMQALYVAAATRENGHRVYRLHALDTATGQEKFGGPVVISGQVPGTSFDAVNGVVAFNPDFHLIRASLAATTDTVYVATAGTRDTEPFHGWIFGYGLSSLQQTAILNLTPNGQEGGVWQSVRAPVIDANGFLYVESGNGDYDGVFNFGESIVKLSTTPGLHVTDWFTPDNWSHLNDFDLDLAAAGPLLVPGTQFLIGSGKTGILYVLNTASMGRLQAGNGQIVQSFQASAGCSANDSSCDWVNDPVFWNNSTAPTLYAWPLNDVLRSYSWSNGQLVTTPIASGALASNYPGGFLSGSSNNNTAGTGILWAITGDDGSNSGNGFQLATLRAFDATNITNELWNSGQNGARDSLGYLAKFVRPVVANGKVYAGTFSSQLVVYGLLPALTVSKSHSGNFVQGQSGATYTVTVSNSAAAGPTSGTVTVTETLPDGLTLISMAGTGWDCPNGGNTCTRSDSLGGSSVYPAITVTVNVSPTAASQVTNQGSVAGGGSDGASIQDVTSILPLPSQTITFGTLTNQPFGTGPFQISSSASSGLTVGINSQTPSVCTISGSIVTLVWVGTCTIQATQSGNTNWASAAPVTRSFQVTGTPCDLKPNSNIDVADVQLIVNQSLGASPAVNDVSGDGAVNVIDVQIELNAALGLGCAWK